MRIIETHIFNHKEYIEIPFIYDLLHRSCDVPITYNGIPMFNLVYVHIGKDMIRIERPISIMVSSSTYLNTTFDFIGIDRFKIMKDINQFYYKK